MVETKTTLGQIDALDVALETANAEFVEARAEVTSLEMIIVHAQVVLGRAKIRKDAAWEVYRQAERARASFNSEEGHNV